MDCELLASCLFFNDKMKDMPATSLVYKSQYCRTDKSSCARYMVYLALGRPGVPADLFPIETERARAIVSGR